MNRLPETAPSPAAIGGLRGELSRPLGALLAIGGAYLALFVLVGRFAVTDEVFFKAAGRQWAAGAGFGAPELEGALGDISPPVTEVFFLHPPAYPFLFGVWTRLFGFGARQCMLFDATLHVFLSGLTFAVAWRAFSSTGRARRWLALGAAAAILPLGTAGRPDELAMCFGALCIVLLLDPRAPAIQLVVAGMSLGACVGTSSGAAIASGLIAVTALLRFHDRLRDTIRRGMLVGAGALVGVAIALGPLIAAHPRAPHQYLEHARYLVSHVTLANVWAEERPQGIKYYTFLLGALASGLLAAALIGTRNALRIWVSYSLGPLLFLLFLAAFLAFRSKYTWFIGPWVWLAAVHLTYLLATTPGKSWRAALPALILFAAHLSFAAHFVKETLVIATLPSSQKLGIASARLRAVIPAGATVLTKDAWWFLAERNRTFEPMFAHPAPGTIDYVALTANGSGIAGQAVPLDPRSWDSTFHARMVEVSNDLPQRPTTFLGVRLTNSAYGFGSLVYRVMLPGTSTTSAP